MRAALVACSIAVATPALAQEPVVPQGEIWELDQVQIARDVPEAKLEALQPDHSLEAVIKTLNGMGIAYKRIHVKILADRLPPKLKEALLALPKGEPFVLPDPDFWAVSVILARQLPPGTVRFLVPTHPALSRKA